MPNTVREYLYSILILSTASLLLVGAVAFWVAITIEGYVAATCILLGAALAYAGARYLKPKQASQDMDAFADYLGGKKTNDKGAPSGN
jgi:hypothetical protein